MSKQSTQKIDLLSVLAKMLGEQVSTGQQLEQERLREGQLEEGLGEEGSWEQGSAQLLWVDMCLHGWQPVSSRNVLSSLHCPSLHSTKRGIGKRPGGGTEGQGKGGG